MHSYDLIIVGGGLVGASLAVALKDQPIRIALIDAKSPVLSTGSDPRLFGLTASSIQFLRNLNQWDELLPYATEIKEVHVSNQGRFGAVRLSHEQAAIPSLGGVIPAYRIEEVLNETLTQCANVTLYQPATMLTLSQMPDHVVLTAESEGEIKTLTSAIVIGADGTESAVRQQAGILAEVVDYQQTAIVTRSRLQRSHHHVAYERFNREGAIAMLPLEEKACATIWTTSHDAAQRLMAASDSDFLKALQTEFGYRLGRLLKVEKRFQFPLRMVKAKSAVSGRVMLIGNAAHTLHPVAAQGFNLALHEVAELSRGISQRVESNKRLDADLLIDIQTKIDSQKSISLGVSDRLVKLFSSKSVMMSGLLQLGMVGLDIVPPLKRSFINRMLGKITRQTDLLLSVN